MHIMLLMSGIFTFPPCDMTKNRIPPKTIYFVIRSHIGEHHPFLSLPCDYAVLPLTMPYDYAQLPLTQHVTVGLINPIWPSTMPNFGMGRPINNNEASKCIRIFSRFFPYITETNRNNIILYYIFLVSSFWSQFFT